MRKYELIRDDTKKDIWESWQDLASLKLLVKES